jgi:hypothetical protein
MRRSAVQLAFIAIWFSSNGEFALVLTMLDSQVFLNHPSLVWQLLELTLSGKRGGLFLGGNNMTKSAPFRMLMAGRGSALLALAILLFLASPSSGRGLHDNVLGLKLGMSQKAVHRRLEKIATLEREERGRQEVWRLARDPDFASLLVGFDPDFKVRYVTAIAREGGRRMSYSELAPIKDARAENANGAYTRYTWEMKPDKKNAGYFLIAEGRDPEFLRSFSIKRRVNKEEE